MRKKHTNFHLDHPLFSTPKLADSLGGATRRLYDTASAGLGIKKGPLAPVEHSGPRNLAATYECHYTPNVAPTSVLHVVSRNEGANRSSEIDNCSCK